MTRAVRLASLTLIAVGFVAAGIAIAALLQAGIGWDSAEHTTVALKIGSLAPGLTLAQAYEVVGASSASYGILIQQLADVVHTMTTGVGGHLQADALETYRWQAGVTLVIAFVAAASLAVALGVALRSLLVGAFTWACLVTTPLFLGSSIVNFKDLPVAAGMTMVSSGLVLSRCVRGRSSAIASGAAIASLGAAITLGVRASAWPLLGMLVAGSLALYAVGDALRHRLPRTVPPLVTSLIAAVAALVFLWFSNPLGRIDLFHWLVDSFRVGSGLAYVLETRTAGVDVVSTEIPWWYLPAWLLAQLPILTTIAVAAGLVAVGGAAFSARWSIRPNEALTLAPLLVQALVIPFLIVFVGGALYDGLRHVLFAVPALLGISSVAMAVLERQLVPSSRRFVRAVPIIAALAIVAAGLLASVRWFPYPYAYINPIAGWSKTDRNWELDYWGVTAVEGVSRLNDLGLAGAVTTLPTGSTSAVVGALPLDRIGSDRYGLYRFIRGNPVPTPSNCEPAFQIERDGLLLGEGLICTR